MLLSRMLNGCRVNNLTAVVSSKRLPSHQRIRGWLQSTGLTVALLSAVSSLWAGETALINTDELTLPEHAIPYKFEGFETRIPPIIEWGDDFLATGELRKGLRLPTGAVWTPSLWVYGNARTALQTYGNTENSEARVSEWVNRLDLFFNLQLSGTERILLELEPLHQGSRFSGKVFSPDAESASIDELNAEVRSLFFEGDFAELFPLLDRDDSSKNDFGFSVGRQDILFQDGFAINDNLDGVGISRNNIRFVSNPTIINMRNTLFYAWAGVHRSDNEADDDARLLALFNQIDTIKATYNIDLVVVMSDEKGDLYNLAIDRAGRIGKVSTTFRMAASHAPDQVTAQADDGVLLFMEASIVPKHSHDNAYLNAFVAVDNYQSAARGPLAGGPLGRTGLLFSSSGIGSSPAPLSNQAGDAVGLVVGYQRFFDKNRSQLITEVGGRWESDSDVSDEFGVALRYQRAIGKRVVLEVGGFMTRSSDDDGTDFGTRLQLQIKL